MVSLIHHIRPENFRQETAAEEKTVLVLCLYRDNEFDRQMQTVEKIADLFRDELKVVLLDENSIEAFKKDMGIAGTPTFLIFQKGRERTRLLGMSDFDVLKKFVDKALRVSKP